MRDER